MSDAPAIDQPHERAMFPLGTALLPGGVLPLHVFEPRYRAMVHDVLAGDAAFGVVLIDRGFEVGGGDSRVDVGTLAQIVQAGQSPDGRFALHTVGTTRLRVTRWLADDPYPKAEVVAWPDRPVPDGADLSASIQHLERLVRRVLAARSELGYPGPRATVALADDPVVLTAQVARLLAIGPFDLQRLLELDGVVARLDAMTAEVTEMLAMAEAELRLSSSADDAGDTGDADDTDDAQGPND